jgi:hypothetical protein
MVINPFGIEIAWYGIPAIIFFGYESTKSIFFAPKGYSAQALKAIDDSKKEFWKSILRHITTVVGTLVTLGLKIPYLNEVFSFLKTLTVNFDNAIDAIQTLLGIVLTVIGLFGASDRFKSRSLQFVEGKEIELE